MPYFTLFLFILSFYVFVFCVIDQVAFYGWKKKSFMQSQKCLDHVNGVFVATLFCKVYNHSVRGKTDFKCQDDNFNEILLKIMGLLPIEKNRSQKYV